MSELAALLRERCWCELGVVQSPPIAPVLVPTAARMVLVSLVQSDRVIDCRVANLGQGAGKGVFAPLFPGDEVLVLFPGGDPMRAVCFGGLGSAVSPNPLGNLGLQLLLQHPGGVQLVTTDGQPAHGIVHGQHLVDMVGFLTALTTFMTAIVGVIDGTTVAPVGPAATAFNANPAVISFLAAVTASASSGTPPGVGGPPHATLAHKVTP